MLFQVLTSTDSFAVPAVIDAAMMLRVWALENACPSSVSGLKAEGEKAEGEKALGLNADGENALGLNADGENALGLNADGENAEGENALGLNADGENALGLNADGENADGRERARAKRRRRERARAERRRRVLRAQLRELSGVARSELTPEFGGDVLEHRQVVVRGQAGHRHLHALAGQEC